jgi:hypothetical protein
MNHFSDTQQGSSIVLQALLEAQVAAKGEDRQRAYQLSLEATRIAPENLEAWLLCAETAPSIEEAVVYLNQANSLQPQDADAKQKTYQVVQKLLEQDPFLRYLDETIDLYHVRSGKQLSLAVPKGRSVPEPYPARRPARLQRAYRWLWMAFLGLLLAGIGALVFAPLAAASAIGLYIETSSKTNRIYSLVVLMLSASLWLFGLLISVILIIHVI